MDHHDTISKAVTTLERKARVFDAELRTIQEDLLSLRAHMAILLDEIAILQHAAIRDSYPTNDPAPPIPIRWYGPDYTHAT